MTKHGVWAQVKTAVSFPRRVFLAAMTILLSSQAATSRGDEPPTYERDIKPFFTSRCTTCHNRKKLGDLDVSAGLALDTYEGAITGTKEHRVVVPGKGAESELFRRFLENDDDKRMPLFEKPLPAPQRELVRRWIDAGAPRGIATADSSTTARRPVRRIVRSLDVVLPIEAKAPPSTAGFGPGGGLHLVLRVGPLPAVSALAFRGDGRLLAVGTHGAVVVWDLADARPALSLTGLPGPVHALAFSRDGRRLAVGSGEPARSGMVRVYSAPDGTLLHDFEGHDDVVFGLAFRPDGGQLASASLDKTIRFWDLALGRLEGVFRGHSDFVHDVAYTRDGRSLLSVSKDRTIKRIDARTRKEIQTYSGYNEEVLAVAIEPGGARFVTSGAEPQLRWWPIAAETPTLQVGGHSGPVHQLGFSGNGKRLVSASGDASVRLWDGASGAFQRALPGAVDWQYAAALSDDARIVAAGGWDGLLRVWDAESGQLRATLIEPPADDPSRIEWLALAPSGYLTASAELARRIRWRVGGVEIAGGVPMSIFDNREEVARSLRGEPVTPPRFANPRP